MRPHRWQPTSLHHPWDSPGRNTGVGCHFLLQCMKVKSENEVAQLCPTLRDPMDCSPPGSSIRGTFQARVLEWGAIAFSAQVPGCIVNILHGCYPALGYVQNCWVVVCCRLIFLMPPGIIPALTIYKVPTATPHVEMQLHFTACQNNRPFWDHCSFFGFWENTILRSMVTCQVQASSRCFFPKWFYYREGLPWNRMFYRN